MPSFKAIARLAATLRPAAFDNVPAAGSLPLPCLQQQTFYHSGDFGDIIYALPAIRALGGGRLCIGPHPQWKTRQCLTPAHVDALCPLLLAQPYVTSVTWTAEPPAGRFIDLNQFREYLIAEPEFMRQGAQRLNLAEAHLYTFKLPLSECQTPWLVVDRAEALPACPVLIHRSARWRNENFPWAAVMRRHGHHAAFVGLPSEHEAFVEEWGGLPFHPTRDFLQLARLIAGCRLYIGNQSMPYAICEGLKHFSVLEVWPEGPNCLFKRDNAVYGYSRDVYIPKLNDPNVNTQLTHCPACAADAAPALSYRTGADIVKCPACDIVYLRTRPDHDETVLYYQRYADDHSHMRLPKNFDEVSTSGLRREYFMTELLEFCQPTGGLLDIGCGWGAFLLNAREKGFTPYGIDICHKAVYFGTKTLGLPLSCEELSAVTGHPVPRGSSMYNAVVSIHTLEHLDDTSRALNEINWLLKPGGVFCGIVPNIESLCSTVLEEKWQWLDSHTHYVHFSPETLRRILEKHGFEVLRLYTCTGDYDQTQLRAVLADYLHEKVEGDELAVEVAAVGRSGKGEEIRFFARKPAASHAEART